ncbi:hypothetical protein GCM10012275_58120 [Longimycelium tulufanense]|uniref:Uncharacterized protein n=1 Tax=Longimycelium tulufanense TaxID=907463 RepID=A0A8J3CJT0_9PSEU|nr:hypothetical protein [Longimycelium tulufanense]GGM79904.1 hypothetical protein GCM10012275_58120 [Longimycelium tulufanense]
MGFSDVLRRAFLNEPTVPARPYPPSPDPFAQRPPPPSPPAGMPSPVRQTSFHAPLRSELPGVWFDATFQLAWQLLPDGEQRHARPEDLVRGYAYEVVHEVTSTGSVTAVEALRAEANRRLGWVRELESVLRMKGGVELTVPPQCAQLAEDHERLRRERQLGRLRRELEAEEIDHLRSFVFGDVVTARVWWAFRNPERIRDIADMDDVFHRLCNAGPAPATRAAPDGSPGTANHGLPSLERVAELLAALDETSQQQLFDLARQRTDGLPQPLPEARCSGETGHRWPADQRANALPDGSQPADLAARNNGLPSTT